MATISTKKKNTVTVDNNIDGVAKSSGDEGDKINVYIPDNN